MYSNLVPQKYLSIFDDDFFFQDNNIAEVFSPVANVAENDKEYKLALELPSLTKEDIEISLKDDVLTISGEKQKETEHKDETFIHFEGHYGKFSRSWKIYSDVDAKKIEAAFKNGVLHVKLPKKKEAIERGAVKKIAIS